MLYVNKTGPTSWDNARTATVIKMWNEGHSASVIAATLGGVSRSAIIGKVHRMGLDPRKTVSFVNTSTGLKRASTPKQKRPSSQVRVSSISPLFKKYPIPAPVAPTLENRLQFVQLENENCRFPLWAEDTPAQERFYCGSPFANLIDGRPYCPWHHKHTHNGFPQRKRVNNRITYTRG